MTARRRGSSWFIKHILELELLGSNRRTGYGTELR